MLVGNPWDKHLFHIESGSSILDLYRDFLSADKKSNENKRCGNSETKDLSQINETLSMDYLLDISIIMATSSTSRMDQYREQFVKIGILK